MEEQKAELTEEQKLEKQKKEAELDERIAEIRRKNEERTKRFLEVENEKKQYETPKSRQETTLEKKEDKKGTKDRKLQLAGSPKNKADINNLPVARIDAAELRTDVANMKIDDKVQFTREWDQSKADGFEMTEKDARKGNFRHGRGRGGRHRGNERASDFLLKDDTRFPAEKRQDESKRDKKDEMKKENKKSDTPKNSKRNERRSSEKKDLREKLNEKKKTSNNKASTKSDDLVKSTTSTEEPSISSNSEFVDAVESPPTSPPTGDKNEILPENAPVPKSLQPPDELEIAPERRDTKERTDSMDAIERNMIEQMAKNIEKVEKELDKSNNDDEIDALLYGDKNKKNTPV